MRSATLNDGENTIPAKFSSDCGGKLSSGAVKDNAVLKLVEFATAHRTVLKTLIINLVRSPTHPIP